MGVQERIGAAAKRGHPTGLGDMAEWVGATRFLRGDGGTDDGQVSVTQPEKLYSRSSLRSLLANGSYDGEEAARANRRGGKNSRAALLRRLLTLQLGLPDAR